ncbi:hypothetical protein GWI33_013299 [Rhynchophorus ferrugineus]|uniref:Uncharacterized protein n=1 Tax=Rhynchophorus ferrugineus TaxID=354439 RepID=A0A834I9Z0_RHYFE|nr:hypothetical protein GWI33_013299 [Rhynchophorus ferrugineus]
MQGVLVEISTAHLPNRHHKGYLDGGKNRRIKAERSLTRYLITGSISSRRLPYSVTKLRCCRGKFITPTPLRRRPHPLRVAAPSTATGLPLPPQFSATGSATHKRAPNDSWSRIR